MLNVETIRKDFPMLKYKKINDNPLVYFDNSATTFKPQCVIDAVTDYYSNYTANAHRGDYELSITTDNKYEHCRKSVAQLLNCQDKEVVFTSGTTMSLNLVAYGFAEQILNEGDVILSTVAEHASNVLPWFRVCEKTKAVMRYIELNKQGEVTIENFKKAMDEHVKVVSIAITSNVLGYTVPIKEICQIAHEFGAYVICDGAQAVPHRQIDVKDIDCDFLAFSAHKMCGPTGVGVLYGKYDLLSKTDPYALGGGSNARFDICGKVILKDAPYKFEAGTPMIEAVIGLDAAIQYLMKVGFDNIHNYELELKKYLIEKMSKLDNIEIYNANSESGIVAFNVKKVFAQDASSYLASKGICVRSGNHCAKLLVNYLGVANTVRASVYFYNTKEEIDLFVEALKTCTLENCVASIF